MGSRPHLNLAGILASARRKAPVLRWNTKGGFWPNRPGIGCAAFGPTRGLIFLPRQSAVSALPPNSLGADGEKAASR